MAKTVTDPQAPYHVDPGDANDYQEPHRHLWMLGIYLRPSKHLVDNIYAVCLYCTEEKSWKDILDILNQHAQET